MNFTEQSASFLLQLAARRRRPVKPATLAAYKSYITKWIIPIIGPDELETFGNGALRKFAAYLGEMRLSPKTITEVVSLTKAIIGSAVDQEGDSIYPRKWNHDFIDLPTVAGQKQPTVTLEQLKAALKSEYRVFWAFLAGTGLRIGEALAVRYGDNGVSTAYDPENAVVRVRTSLWRGREQTPKTPAAIREVDLDPRLNTLLKSVITFPVTPGRYPLFHVAGSFLSFDHLYLEQLKPLGIKGFHTFRRYRATRLREIGVSEDIIRYWLGHAGQGITDRYSKLAENVELRKQWAVRAGLGFELPNIEEKVQ